MILVPALFAFVHFLVASVAAQGTNVTSCVPELYWSVDEFGHTPCFTAAHLYTPCGITNKYLQAIPTGTWYLGPNSTYQDQCGCSSVVYMLTSACGACQGRQWVNFEQWATECPSRLRTIGYPEEVPAGITVPRWARVNVTELPSHSFDPARAQSDAAAELSARVTATSTSSVAPPPSTIFVSTSPVDTAGSAVGNASSGSSAGAIAGGVVGSLLFIAAVGLFIFWLILRKRNRTARELRAKALDLTEEHESHHDPEKPPTRYFGNETRMGGGYAGGTDSPPPKSIVGGQSWHSTETKEWHRRQASSSSGGHGQGQAQGFVNTSTIPGYHHVTASSEDIATGQPKRVGAPPPPIYTAHMPKRPSVDSGYNGPIPLSAGSSSHYSGLSAPGFGGNVRGTTLYPTGYTGAAEPND